MPYNVIKRKRTGMSAVINKKRYKRHFPKERLVYKREADAEVRKLKKKGYKARIISNTALSYMPTVKKGKKYVRSKSPRQRVNFYVIVKRKK